MEIDDEAFGSALLAMAEVDASSRGEAEASRCLTAAIAAYLSALEAKGLCIAPTGPTCEMIEAGIAANYGGTPGARAANCYRAMLASTRSGGG